MEAAAVHAGLNFHGGEEGGKGGSNKGGMHGATHCVKEVQAHRLDTLDTCSIVKYWGGFGLLRIWRPRKIGLLD